VKMKMRISVNASSFHAFTQAADVKVSLCSAAPTAAASSGHTALLAGLCVVSVFLFAALMVIFKQNLGPVNEFLAQVNGLFDRIRACLPGAGSAPERETEMNQISAGNALSVDAGRNLSDSDRAARQRSLVDCV